MFLIPTKTCILDVVSITTRKAMKNRVIHLIIFVFLSGSLVNLTSTKGGVFAAELRFVQRVIDGDTFVLADGTVIRVLNLNTPETKHPNRPVEKGGKEASIFAKQLLEHKYVTLEGNIKDKYGRRLAKVWLTNGKLFADIMKRQGHHKKYRPKYKQRKKSTRYTSEPEKNKKIYVKGYFRKDGTWVKAYYRSKPSKKRK